MQPVAYIIGLDRVGGRVAAVRVRCPWCARVHTHRFPVRGTVAPSCGALRSYTVAFHIPSTRETAQ